MSRRNLNVQTPGETAQPDPQANTEQDQTTGGTEGGPVEQTQDAAALLAAQDELKAAHQRIQELEAEAAVRAASSKADPATTVKPASIRDYSRTPSSEIDAAKLTAPVLSADGWVVPNPPEKKA
ncbi:hypothetical protein D9M72_86010 [compost metagenome]